MFNGKTKLRKSRISSSFVSASLNILFKFGCRRALEYLNTDHFRKFMPALIDS